MTQIVFEDSISQLEDQFYTMLEISELDREPTMEERTLLEDTLKEILASKKKKIAEIRQKRDMTTSRDDSNLLRSYLKELKEDYLSFCLNVVDFIDSRILPKTESAHGKVFFHKVKGDFWRYAAESSRHEERVYQVAFEEGLQAYTTAYKIACAELSCESLIRLNLCLNFSVFYYAIAKDLKQACKIVSETLDKLHCEADSVPEEVLKYIQPTVCLLKNNLLLWISELEDEKEQVSSSSSAIMIN